MTELTVDAEDRLAAKPELVPARARTPKHTARCRAPRPCPTHPRVTRGLSCP
jgi:hypothetical protein